MKDIKLELGVGVFLVIGIASLSFLAIRMGGIDVSGEGSYILNAKFASASGLKEGAQVELAGVKVGKVKSITLDEKNYLADVEMTVADYVEVQEDAIASVRTQGIIGDKFVKISPGGSEQILKPGEEIYETEPSISLEELISKYIFEKN